MTTTPEPICDPDLQDIDLDLDSFANQPRKKNRRPVLFLGILGFVGMLGGASWFAAGAAATNLRIAGTHLYTVGPRTFEIILEQDGEVKAADSIDVANKVTGQSTIIYMIPEGTSVREGDLLVELASDGVEDRIQNQELKEANALNEYESAKRDLEIQLEINESDVRKGELQITLKGLELDRYEQGQWEQAVKQAEVRIQEAQIDLERKAEEYEASKRMMEENFLTKTRFQKMEFDHTKAEWELKKAELAREVLHEYTRKMDLMQKTSDVVEATKELEQRITKNAQAEEARKRANLVAKELKLELIRERLAEFRQQMNDTKIFSPADGVVLYGQSKGRDFMDQGQQVKEGATVRERQVLLTLPDTSKLLVIAGVEESDLQKLKLNQRVTVTIEGVPGESFTGSVTRIAALADSKNARYGGNVKKFETQITLDPTEVELKPGATAHARIFVAEVKDVPVIPLHAVFEKGIEKFVFRKNSNGVEPVEVRLGRSNTVWAEVLDGLSSGDEILLAVTEDQKRLLPDSGPGMEEVDSMSGRDRPEQGDFGMGGMGGGGQGMEGMRGGGRGMGGMEGMRGGGRGMEGMRGGDRGMEGMNEGRRGGGAGRGERGGRRGDRSGGDPGSRRGGRRGRGGEAGEGRGTNMDPAELERLRERFRSQGRGDEGARRGRGRDGGRGDEGRRGGDGSRGRGGDGRPGGDGDRGRGGEGRRGGNGGQPTPQIQP